MFKTKTHAQHFKTSKRLIQKAYSAKGLKKTLEFTTMSGIPLLPTLAFIAEMDLPQDELDAVEAKIQELEEFYITELIR